MEAYEKAREVAVEISKRLKDNHISTMAFGPAVTQEYKEGRSIIPLFVVVSTFDPETAADLSAIAKKYNPKGFAGPFIAEKNDIDGMSDSVPEELLDVLLTYQVVLGDDVLKGIPKLSHEHLRAQAELTIRRYIFNLRWKLTQVMNDKKQWEAYMDDVYQFTMHAIQSYHRLTVPWIQKPEDHVSHFTEEFPGAKKDLAELMKVIKDGGRAKAGNVDLVTNIMTKVLQPLLYKLDSLGNSGK